MDTCDEGSILRGRQQRSASTTAKQLTTYRRYDVGFVFQFYNLVQNLTALENVELAAQICKDPLDAEDGAGPGGPGGAAGQLPRPALRRRAAAGGHRPGPGQKPQAAAVRRAHRRPGLQHRQGHSEAAAGHLPQNRPDGDCHHPQQRPYRHGGPGDPHQKRQGHLQRCRTSTPPLWKRSSGERREQDLWKIYLPHHKGAPSPGSWPSWPLWPWAWASLAGLLSSPGGHAGLRRPLLRRQPACTTRVSSPPWA